MKLKRLRHATLGYDTRMNGPFGKKLITYADFTASGKGLNFVEDYFQFIGETYANTHTEQSYTGKVTTQLYHHAKEQIKLSVGANDDYLVFPAGSGTTGAIDKLIRILGVYQSNIFIEKLLYKFNHEKHCDCILNYLEEQKPVVFISAYEHHSNEVQWRESYVDLVKISLTEEGLFDLEDLEQKISQEKYMNRMKIASISAASNVTGILTPVHEVASIVHQYDGYVFFDYAAAGPYVDIQMYKDEAHYFDGIYLSMHKFLGGPSASGLLIMNKHLYKSNLPPTIAGGGTVDYVTGNKQKYSSNLEAREDAGTPGILQVMRAAMAFQVKDSVGVHQIHTMEQKHITKAIESLDSMANVVILGNKSPQNRLAILSLNIKHKDGYLHQGFVAALLNDLFGIQSRAGCACAGPYGIQLLDIKEDQLINFTMALDQNEIAMKPGWLRVNFHYSMSDEAVDFILNSIKFIANYGYLFLNDYEIADATGEWLHKRAKEEHRVLNLEDAISYRKTKKMRGKSKARLYKSYLKKAFELAKKKEHELYDGKYRIAIYKALEFPKIAWFYHQEV